MQMSFSSGEATLIWPWKINSMPELHLQKPPRTKNTPPETCSLVPQLFLLLHGFCVPVGLFSNVSFLPLSLQREDTGTAIIIFQRVTTDNVIRKARKNKDTESHCTLGGHCNLVEVLLYVHKNHRLIRNGSQGWPSRLSHSSCALTYTAETIRLIRDGEPRMATSTFTQLLCSDVHSRNHQAY